MSDLIENGNADQYWSRGFTIIETLIVIAVGSILWIAILAGLSSRVGSTDIVVESQYFVDQIKQVLTDTTSGYYNNENDSFSCDGNNIPVTFSIGPPNSQGQNYGCIFLGTVVQFEPNNQPGQFTVYPVAGNQFYQSNISQTLTEASPVPAAPYSTANGVEGTVNLSQSEALEGGLRVVFVKADGIQTGAVGFLSGDSSGNLASLDQDGNLNSGISQASLYYVSGTQLNEAPVELAANINATDLMPAKSVQICISAGDNESELVTLTGTTVADVSSDLKQGNNC